MLSAAQWAEIHRLYDVEGVAIKRIVRQTGISRNAVKRALDAPEPPVYHRTVRRATLTDEVEPLIRELLSDSPAITATAIARQIGWTHSMSILRDRVRQLRADFVSSAE